MRIFNHRWNDPEALVSIGAIDEDEVDGMSGGLMRERVDVTINKLVLEYDLLMVVGPIFPHEVVGFSGGNKYLFPGICGPAIIDMFHWLGALITNPEIIGNKYRRRCGEVVDRAAAMVPVEREVRRAWSARARGWPGCSPVTPEDAWEMAAADLSARASRGLQGSAPTTGCCRARPPMYDELWVGGKCVYKLEPVVADGGELIVYAPHLSRHLGDPRGTGSGRSAITSVTTSWPQWQRFADVPCGVLAHSTHVKGIGTFENGVERPRIRVTLATQIPGLTSAAPSTWGTAIPAGSNSAVGRDRQ